MNKLLASASFLVLSSASVMAADLPMSYKSPAPAIVPMYTWTGCYLGVHGGGGAMNDSNSNGGNFEGSSSSSVGGNSALHGTGGLAGGQAGCNYQMTNVVFGVEGEGYWSGMKGTLDRSRNFFSANVLDETETSHRETRNQYDFTIAGRMGVAFDRTLVYGKAGWAWGKFDALSSTGTDLFAPVFTPFSSLSTNTWGGTLNGPLFGLGIEYLVTNNWTVKLEYNYIMFGTRSFATTSCSGSTTTPTTCANLGQSQGNTPLGADKQLFKFGVNYKFDWGALPVIAKY